MPIEDKQFYELDSNVSVLEATMQSVVDVQKVQQAQISGLVESSLNFKNTTKILGVIGGVAVTVTTSVIITLVIYLLQLP